jgi:hypothetical protein
VIIGGKRWSGVRIQRFPDRQPHALLDWEVLIPLESQNGPFKIDPVLAIDLAAGKVRAVEQDLRAHHCGTLRVQADLRFQLGIIDQVRIEYFLLMTRNLSSRSPDLALGRRTEQRG